MNDPILVTVNRQSLTRSQAQSLAREALLREGVPPQMADGYLQKMGQQIENSMVEQFIDQALVRTEAERRGEPVDENEIDAAIARLSEGLPEGMTVPQLLAAKGVGIAELRREIAANERLRKLYEAETAGIPPFTDDQVAAFYRENMGDFSTPETADTRHVLIGCDPDAGDERHAKAKARAETVREELVSGADFAEVARTKSTCPSRQEGGSLGRLERGQTVPEFEQAAFGQEIGEIGPVVQTQFGYHVIQVMDRNPGGVTSQEESGEAIRRHLADQARSQRFGEFVRTLRDRAEITYGDPTGGIIIP
jgi:peptidyl-prolyl cis-trans isomerase C